MAKVKLENRTGMQTTKPGADRNRNDQSPGSSSSQTDRTKKPTGVPKGYKSLPKGTQTRERQIAGGKAASTAARRPAAIPNPPSTSTGADPKAAAGSTATPATTVMPPSGDVTGPATILKAAPPPLPFTNGVPAPTGPLMHNEAAPAGSTPTTGAVTPPVTTASMPLTPKTAAQQGPFALEVLNAAFVDPMLTNPEGADDPAYRKANDRFINLVSGLYEESATFQMVIDNYVAQTGGKKIGVFFNQLGVANTLYVPNAETGAASRVQMALSDQYAIPVNATDLQPDGSLASSDGSYTWERLLVHEIMHAATGLDDFSFSRSDWLDSFDPGYVAAADVDGLVLNYGVLGDPRVREAESTFQPGENVRLVNTVMHESQTFHDDTPVAAYTGGDFDNKNVVIRAYETMRTVLKQSLPKPQFKALFGGLPKTWESFISTLSQIDRAEAEAKIDQIYGAFKEEYMNLLNKDGEDGHYDSLYGTFEEYQDRINVLLAQLA